MHCTAHNKNRLVSREGLLVYAAEDDMRELSTEEVSKEFELWLQPGGAQSRFDHQNRFTGVVVTRFGYALHGIYGTTEVC